MRLVEVMMPTDQLSDQQKTILLQTFMSKGDPAGAAENMKGSEYLLSAGEQLIQMGMMQMASGGVVITNSGQQALVSAGLIDQNGQPTDIAQKLNGEAPAKQPQQQAPQQQQKQTPQQQPQPANNPQQGQA